MRLLEGAEAARATPPAWPPVTSALLSFSRPEKIRRGARHVRVVPLRSPGAVPRVGSLTLWNGRGHRRLGRRRNGLTPGVILRDAAIQARPRRHRGVSEIAQRRCDVIVDNVSRRRCCEAAEARCRRVVYRHHAYRRPGARLGAECCARRSASGTLAHLPAPLTAPRSHLHWRVLLRYGKVAAGVRANATAARLADHSPAGGRAGSCSAAAQTIRGRSPSGRWTAPVRS